MRTAPAIVAAVGTAPAARRTWWILLFNAALLFVCTAMAFAQSEEDVQAVAKAVRDGDLNGALAILERSGAGRADQLYVEGLIAIRQGDAARGATALRRAMEVRPESLNIRLALIRALILTESFETALFQISQAQRQHSGQTARQHLRKLAAQAHARRPYGTSARFGLTPSSNTNRATLNSTVPGFGGFTSGTIDETGRSGIGIQTQLSGYWRHQLTEAVAFRLDGFVGTTVFSDAENNRASYGLTGTLVRGIGDGAFDLRVDVARRLYRDTDNNNVFTAVTLQHRQTHENLSATLGTRLSAQWYDEASVSRLFDFGQVDIFGRATYRLAPRSQLHAGATLTRRNSQDSRFSYDGVTLELGASHSWATGWTVGADLRVEWNDYEEVFGGPFPQAREDRIWGVAGHVQTSRFTLMGAAPQLRCEFRRTKSSIVFYDNVDVEECTLAFTRRF